MDLGVLWWKSINPQAMSIHSIILRMFLWMLWSRNALVTTLRSCCAVLFCVAVYKLWAYFKSHRTLPHRHSELSDKKWLKAGNWNQLPALWTCHTKLVLTTFFRTFEQVQSFGHHSLFRKFVARPGSLYYVHSIRTQFEPIRKNVVWTSLVRRGY